MGSIKVTLDGLEGCAMQFHTVAITLEDLKSSMDHVFGSVDSKIKRRRNIDGSIADIQKSMKALYTEIENISLFVSSSKDTYDKMETRLSRESQFNPFYHSIPNSYYGVWWNGIPIMNKGVGEAVQGRGEMPNPVPALMAWYQDLEKGTKVFFGNARQVVEGIGCGTVDAAKELVYGVADIGKFVYNLGSGLSEFMMDDPFGKSEAWIKQNGSKELKNFIRLKWGGELLPKLWDLSQNKFIETKNKFEKADLKTKSAMATDTVVNLLLIFVPASKISKISKSAEVVEGLSKFEKGAETVQKISLAEKEVKAVEGISKVEKEAKVVEGLNKANRSVCEVEKVAEGVSKLNEGGKASGLLDRLASSGVKYNLNDVVAITKTADGKLTWLENGSDTAGLKHIIKEHGKDFANKGISKEQIPSYITQALSEGKVVGYQGRGTGRPIYEFSYNGATQRVAVTVGSNGFIVGANPAPLK